MILKGNGSKGHQEELYIFIRHEMKFSCFLFNIQILIGQLCQILNRLSIINKLKKTCVRKI